MPTFYYHSLIYLLLLLVLASNSNNLYGQCESNPAQWQNQSDSLIELGKADSAVLYLLQIAHCHFEQGQCEIGTKACNYVANTAIYSEQAALMQVTAHNLQGICAQLRHGSETFLSGKISYYLGCLYQDMGQLALSIEHYEAAIEAIKKSDAPALLHKIYIGAGAIYALSGETQKALNYEHKSANYFKNTSDTNSLAKSYYWLGSTYRAENDPNLAIDYLDQCAALQASFANTSQLLIANIYLEQLNDLDCAQQYAQRFYEMERLNTQSASYADALHLLGKVAFAQQKYKQAYQYFKQAHQAALPAYGKHHADCAKEWFFMGRCLMNLQQPRQALPLLNRALNDLQPQLASSSPKTDAQPTNDFPNFWVLYTLQEIARAYFALHQQNQQTAYLDTAQQYYQNAVAYLAYMQQNYSDPASKLSLNDDFGPNLFLEAINISMQQYLHKPQQAYIEQILALSEQSKSFVLRSQLMDNTAKIAAQIPKWALKREQQLRDQLLQLGKSATESFNNKNWQDSLFAIKAQKKQFEDSLHQLFPNYYQLKYAQYVPHTDSIRTHLGNEKAFIAYQLSDTAIYALVVCHAYTRAYILARPPDFEQQIALFRASVARDSVLTNSRAQYDAFAQYGHQLYLTLLDTVLRDLPAPIQHLCIVPDAALNHLPFAALLTQAIPPKQQQDMVYTLPNIPYLLKDYTIALYPSAFWLNYHIAAQPTLRQQPLNWLAVAPIFVAPDSATSTSKYAAQRDCSNSKYLLPLKHNLEEVNNIQQIMGGKVLQGMHASIPEFRNYASQATVLHLSTHACAAANNQQDECRLYFADDYLSNNDIYYLSLNAQLAVLSACETGNGRMSGGEGVISLARAFMYAGCANVITSLWRINDQSTAQFMQYFAALSQPDILPSQALHQAQITFLKGQNNELSHPYHWAAFVSIGNDQALNIAPEPSYNTWQIGLLLALLLGGWAMLRRYWAGKSMA
jgi:CHAT domain-containing protein